MIRIWYVKDNTTYFRKLRNFENKNFNCETIKQQWNG